MIIGGLGHQAVAKVGEKGLHAAKEGVIIRCDVVPPHVRDTPPIQPAYPAAQNPLKTVTELRDGTA